MNERRFVAPRNVETLVLPWGRLQWLSEPRVTGSDVMTTGIVTLEAGGGHDRHNHPGCEEVIYVLDGEGEQFVELADGTVEARQVRKGDLIHIPADYYHGTKNNGNFPMILLVVYQFAGPEAQLRSQPDCIVTAPGDVSA